MASNFAAFKDLGETGYGETTAGEMDGDKPGADTICEAMQEVGVGGAIECSQDRKGKEQDVGYVPKPG